jgi:hypothetical protein
MLGSLAASYTGVSIWRDQHRAALATRVEEDEKPPVNPFERENGKNLIAFVVTASDCGWSALPATMKAVGSIREKLRAAHGATYVSTSVVGVALDRNLGSGLDFLAKLGGGKPEKAFDQIIVGGSWLNELVIQFVWREGIVDALSPQILLIERTVGTDAYLTASTISIKNDKLLANPRGSSEIVQWVEQGLPLTFVPDAPSSLPPSRQ